MKMVHVISVKRQGHDKIYDYYPFDADKINDEALYSENMEISNDDIYLKEWKVERSYLCW